jgi:hypothetical protein
VGGTDIQSRIQEYLTGIPDWTRDAWDKVELQGVVIEIGRNGLAVSIDRIGIPCPEVQHERNRNSPLDRGGDDNL